MLPCAGACVCVCVCVCACVCACACVCVCVCSLCSQDFVLYKYINYQYFYQKTGQKNGGERRHKEVPHVLQLRTGNALFPQLRPQALLLLGCFMDWRCDTHRVKVTATVGKKYWHDCLGRVKVTATVGEKADMIDCFVDWCCHTHRVKVTATVGKKYWHVLAGSRLQLPWERKLTCLTASWTDAATHMGSGFWWSLI